MSFYDYLKNTFLILLILSFLFPIIETIKKQYSRYFEIKSHVGVIKINKPICDSALYTKQLHTFFKDKDIKAIVLRIDCPGGASGTSQIIHDEILALKKEHLKPIITFVENICASGGYWIAAASDHIIAPGTSLIGSIGVCFSQIPQLKNFLEQFKLTVISMNAGMYKNTANPFKDITAEETAMLQEELDDSYAQFTQSVAQTRNLSLSDLELWANGRIFTGAQAVKLHLIDEIGSLSTLIKAIKDRALVEGEIEWVHLPTSSSWAQRLFGSEDDDQNGVVFKGFFNALHENLAKTCSLISH